jgi:hypothetical protein
MKMLGRLTTLSTVSQRVIGATKESLVNQVNEVGPVLSTLIANMDKMRPLMQGVLDFGKALDSASPGDYARFDLTALLAPGDLSNLPGLSDLPGQPGSPSPKPPTIPGLPGLPGLPGNGGASDDDPVGLGGLLGGGG